MSSRSSYGASYAQGKGAYGQRSSSTASSYTSTSSTSSSAYTHSAQSSRNYRYGNKPPEIHNGGGPINDPNTSTSAPNAGYYT